MKNVIMLAIVTALLMGCGDKSDGNFELLPDSNPSGQTPEEKEVLDLVADENDYRAGLGQAPITKGLACTLYTITGGQRIQATSGGYHTLTGVSQVATFLLTTVINQLDSSVNDGMSVLPSPLRSVYKNMYLLRCQGHIVVRDNGYYSFELSSDDASLLYLDGAKLIDNDNNHGITTVVNQKYLRRGVHTFRLDYAQAGGGNQALILKANGELIDPMYLYH